jgi:hypothetical protein
LDASLDDVEEVIKPSDPVDEGAGLDKLGVITLTNQSGTTILVKVSNSSNPDEPRPFKKCPDGESCTWKRADNEVVYVQIPPNTVRGPYMGVPGGEAILVL